jgi:hypothetical protein
VEDRGYVLQQFNNYIKTIRAEDQEELINWVANDVTGHRLKAILLSFYNAKHRDVLSAYYLYLDFPELLIPKNFKILLQKATPYIRCSGDKQKKALRKQELIEFLVSIGNIYPGTAGLPPELIERALYDFIDTMVKRETTMVITPLEIKEYVADEAYKLDRIIATYNYLKARQHILTLKLSDEQMLTLVTRLHFNDSDNHCYISLTAEIISILFSRNLLDKEILDVVLQHAKLGLLGFILRNCATTLTRDLVLFCASQANLMQMVFMVNPELVYKSQLVNVPAEGSTDGSPPFLIVTRDEELALQEEFPLHVTSSSGFFSAGRTGSSSEDTPKPNNTPPS